MIPIVDRARFTGGGHVPGRGRRGVRVESRRLAIRSAQWFPTVVLLLLPDPARAACNPETCDAFFACGERTCVGSRCVSVPEAGGTPCRAAAGACDAVETCNGSSLSCPTDRKRPPGAVCRAASNPCDAAERCDGVSNACPADTGSDPEIDWITFLSVDVPEGGAIVRREMEVEVVGSNLCNARILLPDSSEESFEAVGDGGLPTHRLSLVTPYATPEARAADYPDGDYPIEINSGAVSGSLFFEAGAPGGAVEVVAPEEGAVIGSDLAVTFVNHCADCTLIRLTVEALDAENRFIGQSLLDGLPVDEPFVQSLHRLPDDPEFPPGDYALHAETLDGVYQIGHFPPTIPEFEYVAGSTLRDELTFTVPEPAGDASRAIVLGILAAYAARRRRVLGVAMLAALLFVSGSADAACDRSCEAVLACGSSACVGDTCVSFPEPVGTTCRPAAGVCDRAESCNGISIQCPADAKHGSDTVCRPAVDACDGAETCDGVSNACSAPDVGVAPQISLVSILDSSLRFSDGGTNPNRFFEVRIEGEQLCEATVDGDPLFQPLVLSPNSSGTVLRRTTGGNVIPSATFEFDINRGAVTGSLSYVAADPDGIVEILSPAFGATLGGNPGFVVSNQCSNCAFQQLEVLEDVSIGTLGKVLVDLPIDMPVPIGLADIADDLAPLPQSGYAFEATAIAGSVVAFRAFEGGPPELLFEYVSGRSIRNRLLFEVPEPARGGAGMTALTALLALGRLRAARDRG